MTETEAIVRITVAIGVVCLLSYFYVWGTPR